MTDVTASLTHEAEAAADRALTDEIAATFERLKPTKALDSRICGAIARLARNAWIYGYTSPSDQPGEWAKADKQRRRDREKLCSSENKFHRFTEALYGADFPEVREMWPSIKEWCGEQIADHAKRVADAKANTRTFDKQSPLPRDVWWPVVEHLYLHGVNDPKWTPGRYFLTYPARGRRMSTIMDYGDNLHLKTIIEAFYDDIGDSYATVHMLAVYVDQWLTVDRLAEMASKLAPATHPVKFLGETP